MDIEAFIQRWQSSTLREQQAAQSHFNELCQMLGQPTPTEADPLGEFFTFEEQLNKAQGGRGRADVWYKDHFAWEYKGKLKDLEAAYSQLLSYKGALGNPPLLVVCDFLEYRIYPQFTGYSDTPFVLHNHELAEPSKRRFLEMLFTDPTEFLRIREREQSDKDILTRELATKFASLAGQMTNHTNSDGEKWSGERVARYLTRILFILFAEDVGLLPTVVNKTLLRYIIDLGHDDPAAFREALGDLFAAMDGRLNRVMGQKVAWFDGGLFAAGVDETGGPDVLDITQLPGALNTLRSANESNWSDVSPTIFGTLFERALDESKRAQLGAHYTSEADIRLVVEPVLMRPLRRQWEDISAQAGPLIEQLGHEDLPARQREVVNEQALRLYDQIKALLSATTVLDPACGSGNFLYMSLRLMKELEAEVQQVFWPLLEPEELVTPRQLFGIEKEPFAAMLARVVIWIGYLQWRYEKEGSLLGRLHEPILRMGGENEPEHIINDDAILRLDDKGQPYEPEWPHASVIVGNPPFLGGNRIRAELGNTYVDHLFRLYRDRIPASADLVCYWFEKARAQIEEGKARRAGLLATNSIRGGANRVVLERIKSSGDIFMAWSDREWVLDGAAVRVSIVGFDDRTESSRRIDGSEVTQITPDLQGGLDLTRTKPLSENQFLAFIGPQKDGPLDIPDSLAQEFLNSDSEGDWPNHRVLKHYLNASDIVKRPRNYWIIDFNGYSAEQAEMFRMPFEYVRTSVKPIRDVNHDPQRRTNWWKLGRSGDDYREAIRALSRQIFTPRVAKHRVFIWVGMDFFPDSAVVAFAREDDYFFGVLHSYPHEIWSLRMGTWLGVGNDPRYTPTTTFETFPLPWPPGHEDTSDPQHAAISVAAKALHEERDAWLNPNFSNEVRSNAEDKNTKVLEARRTLTNLYNQASNVRAGLGVKEAAIPEGHFAKRLVELHNALDAAVLDAYGWPDLIGTLRTPDGDEELLRRLLALNQQRAAAQSTAE